MGAVRRAALSFQLFHLPEEWAHRMRLGRFRLSEISLGRLRDAVRARAAEIPHTLAWDFGSLARENRRRLARYEDLHRGERCFIVANGPSLTQTDLELLAKEVSFGVNRIYLNFDKSLFRPTYFVCMNELVLEQF